MIKKGYGNILDNVDPLKKKSHPYFKYTVKRNKNNGRKRRSEKKSKCPNRTEILRQQIDNKSGYNHRFFRTQNKFDINRLIDLAFNDIFQSLSFDLKYKIYRFTSKPF